MQTPYYNSELQLFLTAASGITETCTHFVDSAREDHPHLTAVFLWDALQHQLMGGMGAVHADTTVQTQKQGSYRPYIVCVCVVHGNSDEGDTRRHHCADTKTGFVQTLHCLCVLYTITVMRVIHADTTVQTQKQGLYRPYIVCVCCTQ